MSLLITVQPTAEPVTVSDVKAVLRLDQSFTADDALIAGHITAAREHAERITCRSLVKKSYTATFERFPCPSERFILPVPPVLTVDAIRYRDYTLTWQTWDPSEYLVSLKQQPAVIIPASTFIYPSSYYQRGLDSVEVDLTAGYGDSSGPSLPGSIAQAIKQIAQYYYDHPELAGADKIAELPHNAISVLRSFHIY